MNPKIKQDLIDILGRIIRLAKKKKDDIDISSEIRKLSNHTIHNASIFQDEDSVSLAVLTYALSKIMQRNTRIDARILQKLESAKSLLKEDRFGQYRQEIKDVFKAVSAVDTKLKLYIEQIINQARIRKGSRLFYHGISLARASEMFNISQWELMSYIGKTTLAEDTFFKEDVRSRIAYAKKIFGVS